MSMSNLSVDGEFRYIVQWFNEWSELQREDFVPVLVEYLQNDGKSNTGVYMNGVVNSVANVGINDKPMSLFQCRIKLFRQWNAKWPAELKHKLQEKITEVDSKIGEKIVNEIRAQKQIHSNGNGTIDDHNTDNHNSNENGEEANTTTTTTAATAAAAASIRTDNHSVLLVNNDTTVDSDTDGALAAAAEQVQMQASNVNAVVTVTQTAATIATTVSNNEEVPLVA